MSPWTLDQAERGSATWYFNLHWQNDQELYNAVLSYARDCLRGVPNMTAQTLGLNVRNKVAAWCLGGGYGYDGQSIPVRIKRETLAMMAQEVGDFQAVSWQLVGEAVMESLGIEEPQDEPPAMRTWNVTRLEYVTVEATTEAEAHQLAMELPDAEWASLETKTELVSTSDPGPVQPAHDPRPDDLPEPGDRCKTCGRPITWIGPSTITDWEHV